MGAYSELDAALREDDGDFVDDDAFMDDGSCTASDDTGGAVSQGEPEPDQQPKPDDQRPPVEARDAAPAQPAGTKEVDKDADEAARRKAHEEAEAKRKAEWEAKQQQKKEAEKLALAKLDALSGDELLAASLKRVGDDTEKLTRRNMKECVAEHIQTLCLSDPAFARKVMHPRKNMIHCIWYINRKARKFIEQELKDNDFPKENGVYGSDVPDGLCYQWAVDYFNDPNAKEDEEKEEKFVPQPYRGTGTAASKKSTSTKGKATKKKDEDKAESKAEKKTNGDSEGQMSLLGVA